MSFFIKALAYVVSFFPRPVQLFLGKILGFLWFDLFRIRRKVVLDNLRLAFPDWTERQRVQTGRASLHSMGHTIVEFLLISVFNPHKDLSRYFEFEGLEYFEAAKRGGKGAMIVTLHAGNGDFGCIGMAYSGFPMVMISKQFKSKWLNDLWFGLRRKHGTEFIREEKSSFEILRALKANKRVIFVLDQFMGPPAGIKTRFFGVETGTAQGLAIFQQRTGSPVLPAYTVRTKEGKIKIIIEKPLEFVEKETPELTISFMTQRYTDKIEEIIRKYPDQWMWLHRRWKKFEVRVT